MISRVRTLATRATPVLLSLFWLVSIAPAQASTTSDQRPAAGTIKTIYIMPSSHWDLGFLAPPEEILPRLKPHLDEVIANAKADPDFRWTIESAWQIGEWLKRTDDPQQIKDFVDLVNKGQIQVSAVFGSMHTEFMGAEELNRITYDMKDLEKRLGIKTDFAIMDDVPGFTSRLPLVLARSGIHYFVNGSNIFLFGGTSLTPGQMPFYWTAPDGSRVLTWQTQGRLGGYTEAMADYYLDPGEIEPYTKEHFYPKEWEGLSRLEIMQRGVDKLLDKYSKANYPYDALLLLDLHDFISSNREEKGLLPAVREWNAAGKQPRIVVCTPAEFFHHMESEYGKDRFPSYSGDYSGLWSEVKTNSPSIAAKARWIDNHMPVAEMLWSLLTFRNLTSLPAGNLEDTRFKLYKYDEHSGAAQVGWPKLMTRAQVDEQNKEYVDYVSTGQSDIEYLLDSGLQTLLGQKPAKAQTVAVFNPVSWQRSEVARLKSKDNVILRDPATGRAVPLQRISPDEVAFFAVNVPALGYKTYILETGGPVKAASSSASTTHLENSFYRLRIRPADGAILSIFDKSLNRELVDSTAGKALNQLLRWTPSDNLPVGLGKVTLTRDGGPIFDRIVIHRPDTFWPATEIRLYHAIKRIEIANQLDRDKMPFVASNQIGEYYSFNFPFLFKGSSQVWLEDGIGYHRIPEDYLPGARTDAGVPQHSLVLTGESGGDPVNITLSQREAFFDYLPGLPGVKGPNTFLNAVRATVMRKQDQGETRDLGMVNFPTVEPGLPPTSWYHFAITSAKGDLDPVASYREGVGFDLPLMTAELSSSMSPAEPQLSYFSLSADNVAILAFKPSTDGNLEHYTLRLQEIAGKAAEVELKTPLKITAAEETSLTEDQVIAPVGLNPLRVHLTPHETFTLRLTIPHPHKTRSDRWWEW
jgi:hypothetical protein